MTLHGKELEAIYKLYKEMPDAIEVRNWRDFFLGFDFAQKDFSFKESFHQDPSLLEEDRSLSLEKELDLWRLIEAYQNRGHLYAHLNPLSDPKDNAILEEVEGVETLKQEEAERSFELGKLFFQKASFLKDIIAYLKNIYTNKIGIEYSHINDLEKIKWIQNWFSSKENHFSFSPLKKKTFYKKLYEANAFEGFLHNRFAGKKRFSLEGGESLIVALEELISYSSDKNVKELVFGMAHRGRLNVLCNIFERPFSSICDFFQDKDYENIYLGGDVKYHLGIKHFKKIQKGANSILLSLLPNPSHLEAVNAIVEGFSRARIDGPYNGDEDKIIPILIHGDGAIAAQGVVYEVVQFSQLEGYKVGGTIHIVLNNQLSFTTESKEARSSRYATDIAKVVEAPIIHVNADEIEEVVRAMYFALDFRMRYHQDIFIDLIGYRKYGHNEGDEPSFTQPSLYKKINAFPNSSVLYEKELEKQGVLDRKEIEEIKKNHQTYLKKEYERSKGDKKIAFSYLSFDDDIEVELTKGKEKKARKEKPIDTSISLDRLKELGRKLFSPPYLKELYYKAQKILLQRNHLIQEQEKADWAIAELLAYGSLLEEGYNIRLSGQDVKRGTFSHRHAIVKKEEGQEAFNLFSQLNLPHDASFSIYNSSLSEYGTLGFDYGYAMASANTLTIWEGQYGDFSNGAQIIIDQYISSAEYKWNIKNGLVLFLPHGYEGQGPEHSSARIERFLSLCSKENIVVVNCTTPANFFHFLRKHMKEVKKKPAIIFTPKSLLRHPLCVSSLEEMAKGEFKEIIEEPINDPYKIEKVVFCSGKLYYDLIERREQLGAFHITFIRIEQLYPLDRKKIEKLIEKYPQKKQLIWMQEEPENMGPWPYLLTCMREVPWELIAPCSIPSVSEGSYQKFLKERKTLLERLFKK